MDKDLIRIIIFAIGLAVIIGMIAWNYIKHEKLKRNYSDYDDSAADHENSELGYNKDDYDVHELEDTDIYHEPSDDADDYYQDKYHAPTESLAAERHDFDDVLAIKKPSIIQFFIVARNELGFNGLELFEILDDVGLEYGNLQIFERLDSKRLVDFGVASMVKPGIFPSTDKENFHSPGIVFFMQPGKVDNSVAVFDDFVSTIKFVADQLDGEIWDQQRQPLTDEAIEQIRNSLDLP